MLHKVLVQRKVLVLHRVLVLRKVLVLHRSKRQEQRLRCMPSSWHANEPRGLPAWELEHKLTHKLELVLEHKQQRPEHCRKPCVSASESEDPLALQLGHKQVQHRMLELVLVYSKQPQRHRYNPSCGRKFQQKHWKR